MKKRTQHYHRKNQHGITLIEMLVYMGLFAILFLVVTEVLLSVLEARLESAATAAVSQDTRYILSRLSHDISRSSSISAPASFGSQASALSLVIDGVTYTYALSNNTLQLTNAVGTMSVNSSETQVPNISFRKLGTTSSDETIQVIFTLRSTSQLDAGKEERVIQTTFGKR